MNVTDKAKSTPLRGSRAKFLVLGLIVVICILLFMFNKERQFKKSLIERKDFLHVKLEESLKSAGDKTEKLKRLNEELEAVKKQVEESQKEASEAKSKYQEKETAFKELETKTQKTEEELNTLKAKLAADKSKQPKATAKPTTKAKAPTKPKPKTTAKS